MNSTVAVAGRTRRAHEVDRWAMVLVPALLVAAFCAGVVLTALGSRAGRFGPLVMLVAAFLSPAAVTVIFRPVLGVGAVFAAFPVGVSAVPGLPLQLVQAVVIGAAVLVVLRRLATGAAPLRWAAPLWWVLGLGAWMLISLPSAKDQHLAIREVALLLDGLLFACVVLTACASARHVRAAMVAFVVIVAGVAATTLGASSGVRASFGGSVIRGRATGVFIEPNQLGTFCAAGAMVAFGLLIGARTVRSRVAGTLATGACVLGLLLSLSRGAWIGFVVGAVVLLVTLPEARRALLALALPTLALAAVLGAFAPSSPQVKVVSERLVSIVGEKNPYDNRPAIWAEGRRQILADPWTGQGPGNFSVASERTTSASRRTIAEHAHNILLTWAAEDGLPAAGFILALTVSVTLHLRRAARSLPPSRADRSLLAALAAALAAVMGQGLVDYTLRNSVIFTMAFGLLGAALALAGAVEARAPSR